MKFIHRNYLSLVYLIILVCLGATLTFCSDSSTNPNEEKDIPQIDGYNLVWNDEFDGEFIDPDKWRHEVNANGGGNNELQYYTGRLENSHIKDGRLIIIAKQEKYTGTDGTRFYTSARMTTQTTKFFKYGKITARIKLPYGQGMWPAFWMLGSNISQVGWPKCGEIDILEMIGGGEGRDNVAYGTLHWDNNGHAQQGESIKLSSGIFADDFHEFTIDWDSEKIKWFLDGKLYYSINITDPSLSAFQQHFFIILNLAVGGNWPGSPNSQTVFPQQMIIDYIRVYEKN